MKKINLLMTFLIMVNVMFAQNQPIRKIVEVLPMYAGCETMETSDKQQQCTKEKVADFVNKNRQYPAIAKDNGVTGTVIVQAVVELDGSLSNARVIRDIGASCGPEALQIVSKMPDWIPAKLRGKAVRTRVEIPVEFAL